MFSGQVADGASIPLAPPAGYKWDVRCISGCVSGTGGFIRFFASMTGPPGDAAFLRWTATPGATPGFAWQGRVVVGALQVLTLSCVADAVEGAVDVVVSGYQLTLP